MEEHYEFFNLYFPSEPDAMRSFQDAIRLLVPAQGQVLDLGCGDNRALEAHRTPAREVWGADLVRHPELAHPDWFRELGPEGQIPFPDQAFDLVTAAWVAEHVREPRIFLAEVARVLRPGGHLVLVTVNAQHYTSLLIRAFHVVPHWVSQWLVARMYGRPPYDTFPTWYRLNTPRQLKRFAGQAGLEVSEVRRLANANYFAFNLAAYRAAVLLDHALERWGTGSGKLYLVATLRRTELREGENAGEGEARGARAA